MLEFWLMLPAIIWVTVIVCLLFFVLFKSGVRWYKQATRQDLINLALAWFVIYIPIIMFVAGLFVMAVKLEKAEMEKAEAWPYRVESEQ
jgi:hypothetical protein